MFCFANLSIKVFRMSSLLRGAMSMFQGDGGDGTTHALVGTDIEVNNVRYRVKDVIAEGIEI